MRSFIIAHRGASYHAPENTLAAFRAAYEQGADGIETDVQLTGDGRLVTHHNYIIEGCSAGSGAIARMSLAELKECDVGAYRGAEWAGERIPTLDECLEATKAFSFVDLELKAPLDGSLAFARSVTEAVKAHGMTDRVVISAFDHSLLREVKRCCASLRVGVLTMPSDFTKNRFFSLLLKFLPAERKLIETTREDLANLPEDVFDHAEIGIRSADAVGAVVELARQIGAVYPLFTIQQVAKALAAQGDIAAYISGLDFKADYLHCHYSSVLREPVLVERLGSMGVGCCVWTPDDPADLERLCGMGCTAIITNRPDLLREIQLRQGA